MICKSYNIMSFSQQHKENILKIEVFEVWKSTILTNILAYFKFDLSNKNVGTGPCLQLRWSPPPIVLTIGNYQGDHQLDFWERNIVPFCHFIREQSGLQEAQFSSLALLLWSHFTVVDAVCGLALSYWKRCRLNRSICCSKICIYLTSGLIVPFQMCKLIRHWCTSQRCRLLNWAPITIQMVPLPFSCRGCGVHAFQYNFKFNGLGSCGHRPWLLEVFLIPCSDFHESCLLLMQCRWKILSIQCSFYTQKLLHILWIFTVFANLCSRTWFWIFF